jgi:hypothetical protein
MPSRAEVLGDRTIRGQKALGVPGGLEPWHPPFPLARGLVGVFGPIIQIAVLAVFDTGEQIPLRGAVALELVRDEHPGDILTPLEELPRELLGRGFVTATLHQDIEHVPVLIHRPPEVVPVAVDAEKDFVQMPCVTRAGASTTQLIRICLAKLATPLADGFVRDVDPACEQQLLHVTVAQAKPIVEPDATTNDSGRETVVLIAAGWDWCIHAACIPHPMAARQVDKAVTKSSDRGTAVSLDFDLVGL